MIVRILKNFGGGEGIIIKDSGVVVVYLAIKAQLGNDLPINNIKTD